MDENRVRAYLNLIQLLLSCPAGEEGNVLQDHSELVDSGLIEVMQEVASRMAADGEQNAAFLQQLADQISQALAQKTQGGDADRNSAYLQLINALLSCPSDREQQILQTNSELLDHGFLQACEDVATNFEEQGEKKGANFLRNLASRLGKLLGLTSSGGNDVENKSPRDYLAFLQLLLQTEAKNYGGDSEPIHAVLQANLDKLNLNLIPFFQQKIPIILAGIDEPEQSQIIAALIESIAVRIYEFIRGSRADNLEIAIAAYKFVLSIRTFETNPEKWAQTQNNLGNAYYLRIRGEKAENIEQAIASYTAALKVYSHEGFPEQWAMTQNNLATAYSDRIRGERAENIEQAIASYTAALKVYSHEGFPQQWAMTQNNLATAYSDRIRGERAENIEQAIASYTAALKVYSREGFPEQLAMTQNNLANAYSKRIMGERTENIEQAIASYTAALEVLTREAFPQDWAMTQNNLAAAYSNRIRGDRADNIEQAIASYTATLELYTREAFPQDWAMTQNNLANAYSNRIRGDRADNIEMAIASYTIALVQVLTREAFPEQWATTQNNLATAYSNRIRGDRADNIEMAIASYTATLVEVRTREAFPEQWATTQNNLAAAYYFRIRENRANNIEMAIALYTAALEVRTCEAFPEDWATTQNNLAAAYSDRIIGERVDNIKMAIASYTAALEVYTREAFPQDHAETLFNLGLAYREVPNLQQAHDTFAHAIDTVEFLRGEIHSGDETKQKLAEEWNKLYQEMVKLCIEIKNYTAAIEYAERSKARNLVELLATRDLYPKGNIPETVLNELSRLRREIDAEQRQLEIEQTNHNSNGVTISGERSPQIDNLQITIRERRSYLTQLRQQLDELIVRDITPIDPDFALTQEVKSISYSEIQSLTAENTAILQWYITNEKFLAFIITPKSSTPIVWQSSTADFEALENLDNEYQKDYKNYTESKSPNKDLQWQQKLTSRLQNLAEILHLDEILKNIPKQCSQLILIPHRFLHLFPLHALPVSHETWQRFNSETPSPEPTNPCPLDCFKQGVRYAPSCQLLQQAQSRKRPNFTHLFAIANPTKDRYLIELEAANICELFKPNDFLVKKDDANKKAIQSQQLSLANCAHFGCHGKFEPDSPLESALQLANKERLTLLEILNLDLNQCRLVTLSACETGLTESKTSDEYIGLPFGFLLAGSPSMVSTLWEVDQLASTLLLMRFYENLETLSTAAALNEAQQWLRNLTSEELEAVLERLKPQIDRIFEQLPLKYRTLHVEARLNRARNRQPFPFVEPHYWAGFTAIGV
ncbi:CHAT domain-containing protein [Microcoleus sp. CAWBG50]|uniref:CHAT domain-containing protein n=1 Tax=Microcoleus sp. CAWBG50 TaxID=2841646 RepID=UPI0025E62BC6|nr:CHAT domain-containing protein [Microcoleus sp. CAWBG50]